MLKAAFRTQNNQCLCYCTKAAAKNNPYSQTVLLPKTKFPLRLEGNKLIDRDKQLHHLGGFDKLYDWQKTHLYSPEFVLHDGPPYANGKPHMGHAINKILKDTILRYQILKKRKVNYIPGWDCHGLPIELKALSGSKDLDPIEIRTTARNFAKKTVGQQMESFKSWGVISDWENRYETNSTRYTENQFKQFLNLYEKEYIYQDFKPIYWSPSSRTALAEAELEYNDNHISPSIYVRLLIKNLPEVPNLKNKKVYTVIWTTTPWTLPSNQVVCYNNSISYCIIKKPDPMDQDLYVIATDLFEKFCEDTNCSYLLLGVHSGEMLRDATYVHPIYREKVGEFVHSSHVTSTKGTGLVHTAPAHGPDDFLVAIKNKISIVNLVDDEGRFKPETGEKLANKFVLTEGTDSVLNILGDDLLHRGDIRHSYPYDWRTKKPVIIKASKQWFIDTERLKERSVELLENVEIIPKEKSEIYKSALVSQLKKRPYWCISRQRKWGAPIPVFYSGNSEEVLVNRDTINHLCELLRENGSDFWWKLPVEKLLPRNYVNKNYTKGEDILDIWFDSGISWSYVLKNEQTSDLYLEGVDQFTGWFQSSLLTSVALRDRAPFKAIFVHGFAVDRNGAKMSKSQGNVVDPADVMCGKKGQKPYGVDTLRWWVACHANQVALAPVSDNILDQSKDEVQKIRSIMRFALGAIFDYRYDEADFESCSLIDRYILHSLHNYFKKCQEHINSYNFQKINSCLAPFLANEISALYFTSIKDRLYCDSANSSSRRSAQYTLIHIFYTVCRTIGGILPHLVEELYAHLPEKNGDSYFMGDKLEVMNEWEDAEVEEIVKLILEVKREVNRRETSGASGMDVELQFGENEIELLKAFSKNQNFTEELKHILQVSSVQLIPDSIEDKHRRFSISMSRSKRHSCPRCRLVQSNVENDLCARCESVVNNFEVNKNVISG